MSTARAPLMSRRVRQAGGCCTAAVQPDLSRAEAVVLAALIKALADPTRLQIVDALRVATPEAICQCELTPLFDMSQQALSKHLRVLGDAGVIGSERRGLWIHYFLIPDALRQITAWLD